MILIIIDYYVYMKHFFMLQIIKNEDIIFFEPLLMRILMGSKI